MQRWIQGTAESYQAQMPFDVFKSKMTSKATSRSDTRSAAEILANVKNILDGGVT